MKTTAPKHTPDNPSITAATPRATPEQIARNHARLHKFPTGAAPLPFAPYDRAAQISAALDAIRADQTQRAFELAADAEQTAWDEIEDAARAQHAAGRNLPLFA